MSDAMSEPRIVSDRLDPLGSNAMAGVVDLLLIAASTAALLTPFAAAFVWLSLNGADSLPVLGAGLLASVILPPLVVQRIGTPCEAIRRRAGIVPVPAAEEAITAPVWRRAAALLLDASCFVGLGVALLVVPVGLMLVVVVLGPVAVTVGVGIVGAIVAAYVIARRPSVALPSPGLEVCGLRRVHTVRGVRTVRAAEPAGTGGRRARTARLVTAWLWVAVTLPVTLQVLLGLASSLGSRAP
jgi:hypothetical protein